MKTKFCGLSSLVLVDTLAALPMEHVVRMARLGHGRLQQTCSLKWVTQRMTNVTFKAIVQARQAGNDMTEGFRTKSVMKRLNGRVVISNIDIENPNFLKALKKTAKQLGGGLHGHLEGLNFQTTDDHEFKKLLAVLRRFSYASYIYRPGMFCPSLMNRLPELSFEYKRSTDGQYHLVDYRPALLNGRHVVDVLRAVCGPADVSEAELDHARREATKNAYNYSMWNWHEVWRGVWHTSWRGAVIVARV